MGRCVLITSQDMYPGTSLLMLFAFSVLTLVPQNHWTPFISADMCSFLSYVRRCTVKNVPSEEASKFMFPLLQTFFSSYIFQQYNLSLITAWSWQDLDSQNLLICLDLRGDPIEPNTENFSPPFLTNGREALARISTVAGSSITHEGSNPTVE